MPQFLIIQLRDKLLLTWWGTWSASKVHNKHTKGLGLYKEAIERWNKKIRIYRMHEAYHL